MKTLIIHPKDSSTTFLEAIYKNIEDKTVITGGLTKDAVRELISNHDRVMMMGHGCPYGLFGVGKFITNGNPYIIDFTMVEELKKKDNSIFIWCNADEFVNRYQLKGLYSGMFISEIGEAFYCGLPGMSRDIIDESNDMFCEIASKYITEDIHSAYEGIRKEYGVIAEENPVALYNYNRLYKRVPDGQTTI